MGKRVEMSHSQIANTKVHGRGAEVGGGNKGGEKQMDAQVFKGAVHTIW